MFRPELEVRIMIAYNKFRSLDAKQKIYKVASTLRGLEEDLKNGRSADPSELRAYLNYLEKDRATRRIGLCLEIAGRYPVAEFDTSRGKELIRDLNFCYHELLDLINEAVSEKFYSVRRMDSRRPARRYPVAALLDNIRSPFNVGNMFRSADCLGVGALALCGITPHPPSLKIERTAMGTLEDVEWSYYPDCLEAIAAYREKGWRIIALETVENALPLGEFRDFENSLFIFGNEEFGITEPVLARCDAIVEIPLAGRKNSMNVANSFAIVFYEAMRQLGL